jgi:hypothetical protein
MIVFFSCAMIEISPKNPDDYADLLLLIWRYHDGCIKVFGEYLQPKVKKGGSRCWRSSAGEMAVSKVCGGLA